MTTTNANGGRLTLSDDEAAALAVLAKGAWRAPLPTVEAGSETEMTAAVLRGRRSLLIRDLAGPDGTPKDRAERVLAGLGGGPVAAFMLVNGDDRWIPDGLTVFLYGKTPDDIALSHLVAAAGTHYFRIAPPPRQWLALAELATGIAEDGFRAVDGGGLRREPAAALLMTFRGDGIRSLRVARGTVAAHRDTAAPAFTSVPEATAWLLA